MKLLIEVLSFLKLNAKNIIEFIFVYIYRLTIPFKVRKIKKSSKIKVLFLLTTLPKWKTEELYREMLYSPYFEPILGTAKINTDEQSEVINKHSIIKKYLESKNYKYLVLDDHTNLKKEIKPDIIFYQEPYYGILPKNLFFTKNTYALFCYAHYGYYSIDLDFSYNCTLHWMCWQVYYENDITLNAARRKSKIQACNGLITGLPMSDILLRPKNDFVDPWKKLGGNHKRIIWAPHHTIPTVSNYINYSIFLDIADYMIDVAIQFKDTVQFAFKPHPDLKKKLYKEWGKERTDSYYQKWETMYNTQIEQGDYIGLFKYSDAMIHDCASFTIEYLYTANPVMYLENDMPHVEDLTEFGKQAYNLHYKGRNINDILQFIRNILDNSDVMYDTRKQFIEKKLLPPNNRKASENIIDEILKNRR